MPPLSEDSPLLWASPISPDRGVSSCRYQSSERSKYLQLFTLNPSLFIQKKSLSSERALSLLDCCFINLFDLVGVGRDDHRNIQTVLLHGAVLDNFRLLGVIGDILRELGIIAEL